MTPGVGAIVGAKPGYQPLYRNVYIFTASRCLSPDQADPQLHRLTPVTPGPVVTPRGLTTVMAPALVLLATGVM